MKNKKVDARSAPPLFSKYIRSFKKIIALGASIWFLSWCQSLFAQTSQDPVIRMAELTVDPAQLDKFNAASIKHIAQAIGTEPGVLAIHAVSEKEAPNRVRVFEIYRNRAAYEAHIESAHFKEFRAATDGLISARTLQEASPIRLGAKSVLTRNPVVRTAEIEVDSSHIDAYRAAVTEEIDASIQKEPGVLTIYAVALRDKPTHLRFFEIYADDAAYRLHIASPHFKKYVDATKSIITSRKLIETIPIALGKKPDQ